MKKSHILKFCVLYVTLCIFILFPFFSRAGVKDTRHNLSVSGIGDVRAAEEKGICIFCHTPHNASPAYPLWNHEITAVRNYVNYWSPTLKAYSSEAEAPPIDGFSKLCLSCHDGTVALGAVQSRWEEITMVIVPGIVDESGRIIGGSGYLGTDLSGGHPLSFIFDEALKNKRNADPNITHLNWPIIDPDVKLYPTQGGNGVQCTSCHDPHGTKGGIGAPPFWRKSTHDDVCLVCHELIPPGNIQW